MSGKLRITGGSLLGRLFDVPNEADIGLVRPVGDRVREAIFSALGSRIKNKVVLDLFSGSGAYSFESLSRGAKSVVIIEKNHNIAYCIFNSIQKFFLIEKCYLIIDDVICFIFRYNTNIYDIVFIDPPYSLSLASYFWIELKKILNLNTIIIYRCINRKSFFLPCGYIIIRQKLYGGTYVVFLKLDI
jgi:16S rRNA (guanine966-N2)-methyltransferase